MKHSPSNFLIDRPSSKDVARLAQVSQATVSRVLNHPEKVGAKTREKVYKAIKTLNYLPNQSARDLVSGGSKIISLISGTLKNPFFVESTMRIVQHAMQRGYKINIYIIEDEGIEESYRAALATQPKGIIMSCILYEDPIIEQLNALNIPFVSYNRRHHEKLNYVELDNYKAAAMGCELLYKKKYDSIFWIGGRLDVSTFRHRYEGFCNQYLHCYQKPLKKEYCYNPDSIDFSSLIPKIKEWYQTTSGKKAIFAATDAIALEVMNYTKKLLNLHCPNDIGILGIDNVKLSSHSYLDLTTIGPTENLGLTAIKLLIDNIEFQKQHNINVTFPPQIFERGSL